MRGRGKELAIDSAAGVLAGLLYSRFAVGYLFSWVTLALPVTWVLVSIARMAILERRPRRDDMTEGGGKQLQ